MSFKKCSYFYPNDFNPLSAKLTSHFVGWLEYFWKWFCTFALIKKDEQFKPNTTDVKHLITTFELFFSESSVHRNLKKFLSTSLNWILKNAGWLSLTKTNLWYLVLSKIPKIFGKRQGPVSNISFIVTCTVDYTNFCSCTIIVHNFNVRYIVNSPGFTISKFLTGSIMSVFFCSLIMLSYFCNNAGWRFVLFTCDSAYLVQTYQAALACLFSKEDIQYNHVFFYFIF